MKLNEIFLEKSNTLHLFFEDSHIEDFSSGEISGMGIRRVKDNEKFYEAFDSPEDAFIEKTLKKLGITVLYTPITENKKEYSLKKYISFVSELDKDVRKEDKVKQFRISLSLSDTKYLVLNSKGIKVNWNEYFFTVRIELTAGEKDKKFRTREVLCFRGEEDFSFITKSIREKTSISLERALSLLKAPPSPVGKFPVVIHSSCGGTLIHEAIGHSLEADLIQKGTSPVYAGKIGEKVASNEVTVIDDPTIEGQRGFYEYDSEGTKAEKVILIEKGVLKNYLYDNYTASIDNARSNGHGRRQSYKYPPIPRMGITFLASGRYDPNEIISMLDRGILVKKMGGGEVNTSNGDFVFEVEEGYWVEKGKIKNLLTGATLIGNGPEILRNLKYIGNDFGFDIGTCGKQGQGVPVSDGMPTVYIDKIVIGGQKG